MQIPRYLLIWTVYIVIVFLTLFCLYINLIFGKSTNSIVAKINPNLICTTCVGIKFTKEQQYDWVSTTYLAIFLDWVVYSTSKIVLQVRIWWRNDDRCMKVNWFDIKTNQKQCLYAEYRAHTGACEYFLVTHPHTLLVLARLDYSGCFLHTWRKFFSLRVLSESSLLEFSVVKLWAKKLGHRTLKSYVMCCQCETGLRLSVVILLYRIWLKTHGRTGTVLS